MNGFVPLNYIQAKYFVMIWLYIDSNNRTCIAKYPILAKAINKNFLGVLSTNASPDWLAAGHSATNQTERGFGMCY